MSLKKGSKNGFGKLPPLKAPKGGQRVAVVAPPEPPKKSPTRFRPVAVVRAASEEFKNVLAELGQEREVTDQRIEELRPALDRMREVQEGMDKKGQHLTVEEETIILEAHFSKGIGPKAIATVLGRPHSTISRFIQRYTSTAPIAAATMKAGAKKLAERVIKHANVTESLEVLDRLDALPKKQRSNDSVSGPQFNVFIGGGSGAAPPVPTQKAIDAVSVKVVENE